MTSTVLRFEPIAAHVSKLLPVSMLLPPDALEKRWASISQSGERGPVLPSNTEHFMLHYFVVVQAAWQVLRLPPFVRLSRFSEQLTDEYQPGGPPMSPVYDSFATQHLLGGVPTGLTEETPYSVLVWLTHRDASRAAFHEMARALNEAHVDLYRVVSTEGVTAQLENVREAGASFTAHLTGPFLRAEDALIMARVVPFQGNLYVADSPYLLTASQQAWLDYLERVGDAPAAIGSQQALSARDARGQSKLTSKQARLRKERLRTSNVTAEQLVRRHLKRGPTERYWLDYIMDAYAGERRGIVFLAGIPDRPQSLPHSDAYDPMIDGSVPETGLTLPSLRDALTLIAERKGLQQSALMELHRACIEARLPPAPLSPAEEALHRAYYTLGACGADGLTALAWFEREQPLLASNEYKEIILSLKQGWFSVFRIDRVHLDQGLDVFDVLRRKRLHVSERTATRQLANGDLLFGWLCEDSTGTLRLEGGVAHVPSLVAAPFSAVAKALRDAASRSAQKDDWKIRASHLPPLLIAALRAIRAKAGRPNALALDGLPAEVLAQIHTAVLQQIRSAFDVPIPLLRNKTLRETARRESTRPDAVSWLRDQERMLKLNPQMKGIDLRPLWADLGIEYQGLDTDPSRH